MLPLDLTIVKTYAIPISPTAIIVREPNAYLSAPFQEDTSNSVPSPFVDTYQTKYADAVVIKPIMQADRKSVV